MRTKYSQYLTASSFTLLLPTFLGKCHGTSAVHTAHIYMCMRWSNIGGVVIRG